MWIATSTFLSSGATGTAGKFFRMRPAPADTVNNLTPQFVELTAPSGFNATNTQPDSAVYDNRFYLIGAGTDNLLIDENFRLLRQGMRAPVLVPTVTAAAGPGRTGTCSVRIALWDELTDEWSPLSAASADVELVNQKATVTNLPTSSDDNRATHLGIFVSMDGASYRLSTTRQLGITTVTEGVATLALGFAFFTDFERMPRASICAVYHDRLFMAGVFGSEDTLYASAAFRPERWEGLSFKTRNGEPIVSIVDAGSADILLVLTAHRAYVLRGYTEDDMELKARDEDIGAICHAGVKAISGNVVVPSDKTIYWFNGSFHNILRDRQTEWQEAYASYGTVFEAGFAVVDPNDSTYTFYVPGFASSEIPNPNGVSLGTIGWVMDYTGVLPELSGTMAQPDWGFTVMSRGTDSAGVLRLPGAKRGDVFLGHCDGKIRQKTNTGDTTDDSDSYLKRAWIRTGHYLFGDPGGDTMEGKSFPFLWSYFMSEFYDWIVYVKAGDEQAYRQITPDNTTYPWKDSVAASQATGNGGLTVYLPKTLHVHGPQKVSGRGLTVEYTWFHGASQEWYGFGGYYVEGPVTRLPETVSDK